MVLMWVVGAVFVVGVALTLWWGGSEYVPWPLSADARTEDRPGEGGRLSVGTVVLRYLRGLAIAMVGGFWAGVLVTGPGVRLIMRLLAVTAGDQAQGRLTEADEVDCRGICQCSGKQRARNDSDVKQANFKSHSAFPKLSKSLGFI